MNRTVGGKLDKNAGFEEIYVHYFTRIYRFVFRLIAHPEDAKDLSQETFIKLDRHLDNLDRERLKAWIYKVAANLCLNHLKRKKRFGKVLEEVGNSMNLENSTEEDFFEAEKIRSLRDNLEKLAPRDRVILGLYQDGLSYNEMAEVMKIKQTSIGKTLSRAIVKLAGEIKKEQSDELCKK